VNFVQSVHLFVVLLRSIAWHAFMSLLLDDFAKSITPLVSSSLLILGPSPSSPCVTAPSPNGRHHKHAFSWAPCELCLTPCVEDLTAGSLLIGWQTVQIVTLPWIVSVRQTLLKSRLARRKVSFPYGVAREPNYNTLSEWMVYYSRYAIEKKDVTTSHNWTWRCCHSWGTINVITTLFVLCFVCTA
jgi:hypothetical protein